MHYEVSPPHICQSFSAQIHKIHIFERLSIYQLIACNINLVPASVLVSAQKLFL